MPQKKWSKPGLLPVTLGDQDWKTLFSAINEAVEAFNTLLGNGPRKSYLQEWDKVAKATFKVLLTNATATYRHTASVIFEDPQPLYDYAESLLKMVPHIREVIKIEFAKTRSQVLLTTVPVTDVVKDLQLISTVKCRCLMTVMTVSLLALNDK